VVRLTVPIFPQKPQFRGNTGPFFPTAPLRGQGIMGKVSGETHRGETAFAWLLHFADVDPMPVTYCPPVDHAQVLADHPLAVAAEPVLTRPQPLPADLALVVRDCLAAGSLAAGDDEILEAAYGTDPVATRVLIESMRQTCDECRHLARPGLSDGYCGNSAAGGDLAYGLLHHLPADRGATCRHFEGRA
jgi:hypothetical protein